MSGLPKALESRLTKTGLLRLSAVFGEFKAPSKKTPRVTRVDAHEGSVFAAFRCDEGSAAQQVPVGVVWDEASGKQMFKRREIENGALGGGACRLVGSGLAAPDPYQHRLYGWNGLAKDASPDWEIPVHKSEPGWYQQVSIGRSSEGGLLATASSGAESLKMWKLGGKSRPQLLWKKEEGRRSLRFSVAFSNSGSRLATGTKNSPGTKSELKIWTSAGIVKAKAETPPVQSVAWSHDDDKILALVSQGSGKVELNLRRSDSLTMERTVVGKQFVYWAAVGVGGGMFVVVADQGLEVFDDKCKLLEGIDLKGVGGHSIAADKKSVYVGTFANVVLQFELSA